jgi:hypothetical protein
MGLYYGSGDLPIVGDWDGDCRSDVGVRRGISWLFKDHGQRDWGNSLQAGDIPLVGDWNGDGRDDLGIRRGSTWILDGVGEFDWGNSISKGDIPIVGDWNGDGRDDVGLRRGSTWILYGAGQFDWGNSISKGDIPIVGDWNGDGIDDVGVRRGSTWLLYGAGQFDWGNSISKGDIPIVGDWNGDGIDDVGVRRGSTWILYGAGQFDWGNSISASLTAPSSDDGPSSVDTFVTNFDGHCVDFDGLYGAQCVDLFSYYNRDVVGAAFVSVDYAYQIWNAHDTSKYDQVSASATAHKGDVAIYDSSLPGSGGAGHVAIVLADVNGSTLNVFDQNNPVGACSQVHNFSKSHLLGYLRPKSL